MTTEIQRVSALTQELAQAFGRLMPQLSERAHIPSTEELEAIVRSDNAALFVACDAGRPVGVLTLAWYDAPSGRKAWIEDVVVEAAQRGRGTGGALVEAAVAHAAAIGAERVSLTSNPARTAAHALYLKAGFEKAETTLFVRKL